MVTLAFFIGLLGSVHCIGMCGPILFSLPNIGKSSWQRFVNALFYQLGRVFTYGLLGLFLGLLSLGASFGAWQQYLSIITGIFLLAMGVYHLLGRQVRSIAYRQQRIIAPILAQMGYWLNKSGGHFMVGVLNGLLPCGMVYMAMAAALNTGNVLRGFLFMLFFGLGTLPLMLISSTLGGTLKSRIKFRLSTWLPFVFIVMGIWFVLRGANLGIPYLSPLMQAPSGTPICK